MCIKTFTAGGAIANFRFAKFGAADGQVLQAAAATDLIIGIVDTPNGVASGERLDVRIDDVGELELGGTVTRGQFLTADASGKGVTAAPAAGVNAYHGAQALVSGVAGDIIPVQIVKGAIQG